MEHREYERFKLKMENKSKEIAKETNEKILKAKTYCTGFMDGMQYAMRHIQENKENET